MSSDDVVNGGSQVPAGDRAVENATAEAMRAGIGPDAYKAKICPILTLTTKQVDSGAALEARCCAGPKCMLFVPISDVGPDGKPRITDGQCAFALVPTSISMLANTHIMLAQQSAPQRIVTGGNGNIPRRR